MEDHQPSPALKNKRVTVMGLGRFGGGIAVARFLVQQGASVLVTDKDSPEQLAESIRQLSDLPIEYRLGQHLHADFTSADLVVTSPAVPPNNEFLVAAAASGIPITTEICLFTQRCNKPFVAVTGTKGKSTTTALLSRMLETRHRLWTGGNIGKSLLADLPNINSAPNGYVLLEVSSYMLHYLAQTKWAPRVGVVTTVTADHLDWHGGLEGYVAAKQHLIRFQSSHDHAILNKEDPVSRDFAPLTHAEVNWFDVASRPEVPLKIPGSHNQQNAQAALAAASVLGITHAEACAAVAEFAGLPHRLELIHTSSTGVRYVNDSIATIPQAAVAALHAFPPGRVIQIVGGYDKHLDMTPLTTALAQRAKAVLTIGTIGPSLASACRSDPHATASIIECGTLSTAMDSARSLAAPGDVILLSTGCASYDQFPNFEKRGLAFAEIARSHA